MMSAIKHKVLALQSAIWEGERISFSYDLINPETNFKALLPSWVNTEILLDSIWDYQKSQTQPFIPTIYSEIEGKPVPINDPNEDMPNKELLSVHTVKDLIGCRAILEENTYNVLQILPDQRIFNNVTQLAIDEFKNWVNNEKISKNLLKLFYTFIFYHDIGKVTGDRGNHEKKGADKFARLQINDLTDKDKKIIEWTILYHGIYADIDRAKKNDKYPMGKHYGKLLEPMLIALKDIKLKAEDMRILLRLMGLFNFVEGLESDQFSWTMTKQEKYFIGGYKYKEIMAYYDYLIGKLGLFSE